jgi:hypothetical protein
MLISLWLLKGILLLQDNAAPHKAVITHHKLADLRFEVLKHPAYSADLAPSDYCLFPNLKKQLKGRKFSSTEKATLAVDGWLSPVACCFLYKAKDLSGLPRKIEMLTQRVHSEFRSATVKFLLSIQHLNSGCIQPLS